MMFSRFSPKQIKSMLWWKMSDTKKYDAIVCDGSVRSGKTVSMTIGFVLWSCSCFNGENFAFCGKTIDSLKRNVITPMQKWLEGVAAIKLNLSRNFCDITIEKNTNRYYFFGGKDESSYQLIQGITLAGVLFDEVALMPKSFVDQALARCSVQGSKFWFNCNPDAAFHWFNLEWVDENQEAVRKKNRLRLHFTMKDNYSLSDEVRQRYEKMYTGVFYQRYILGLWVVAEGLIYAFAAQGNATCPTAERKYTRYHISIDYGTLNPTSMGLWGLCEGVWYRISEYYYSGRKEGRNKTDEEYYTELEKLAADRPIKSIIIDPSAASFIECIRRHRRFFVVKANNDVLEGIRNTATALQTGKIKICDCCASSLAEFSAYRWNEKSGNDAPIKENDHAMDDIRYFVNTVLYNKGGFFVDVR